MTYNQPVKDQARELVLSSAIIALTDKKSSPALIDVDYVRRVKKTLLSKGSLYDKEFASILSEENICKWENFYSSNVVKKTPSQLKVAYFSGPNPENDLAILTKFGILPENVWAFESDNKTYDIAIMSALQSSFPFIKIYKGKIQNFFEFSPTKFDIVYLDFCGSVVSSETLKVLTSLISNQVLSSQSVLITNFAFPDHDKNSEAYANLIKLCTNYIYPKEFIESTEGYGGGAIENPEVHGLSINQFYKLALNNPENIYSQFVTRFVQDLATVIIPYQRLFINKPAWNLFFNKQIDEITLPEDRGEDLFCFPSEHSIVVGLCNLLYCSFEEEELENEEAFSQRLKSDTFGQYIDSFVSKLGINQNDEKLHSRIDKLNYLINNEDSEIFKEYSDRLVKIAKNWNWQSKYIFCDVFLFHQVKDILVRQISMPYHYNLKKSKRWTYKAKNTKMFLDMFVFDECRYIYDWMPTIDMFENGISDMDRQLILRFALDGLSKHNHWYNPEYLSGTAVISMDEKGFEVHELSERTIIN